MRSALRKLEAIHAGTAASSEERLQTSAACAEREKEKKKRLAKLSPYKRCEYECLECIQKLREALRESKDASDALQLLEGPAVASSSPPGAAAAAAADEDAGADRSGIARSTKKVKLNAADMNRRTVLQQQIARSRQTARRAYQQLQTLQKEAHSLSSSGKREETSDADGSPAENDFPQLNRHIESAKCFYREEFHITVVTPMHDPLLQDARLAGESAALLGSPEEESASDRADAHRAVLSNRERRLRDLFGGNAHSDENREDKPTAEAVEYRNAREDAEFQQFFLEVRQNDELMDQALDRIAAGVHRVRDNALGLQGELATQSALLSQTETNIERNQEDLQYMNRRLRHAIRELDDSSICSYVLCLLALLLVLAVLVKIVD